MRIAVDVMGGDNAPDAILAGCLQAVELLGEDDTLVLIGDPTIIGEALDEASLSGDGRFEIEPSANDIGMAEQPVAALRDKPGSSIVKMGWLGGRKAGDRYCDVVISAGNTGACVASAQMAMRRLKGVHRPGVAVTMPTFHGAIVLCDVGANPDPKPIHLHQYGHMAGIFANQVLHIDQPRISLLSIGGEEGKGNLLTRESHRLMKADPTLNYIGYIEGRELFFGNTDVVVTEGFTGNAMLKLTEGLSKGIFELIAKEIFERDPELAMKFEPIAKDIFKKHDYHEYGGAPLMGANGCCFICHGSSEARTIKNAIRHAMRYMEANVNEAIVADLAEAEPYVERQVEEAV